MTLKVLFQSLEDKINGKISLIKSYLLCEVYDLKNDWQVLQGDYLAENPDSNEKEKIWGTKTKS